MIFPHHENEIAQSEGASGKPFVKYWMHNHMLTFGERKMSKSVGNIVTARDFLAQYNAEIMKYMMLSVHYRSLSDFSDQAIHFAISGLARVYSALNLAQRTIDAAGETKATQPPKAFVAALEAAGKAVTDSLNDDFNTPEMLAGIYSLIRAFNSQVRLGANVSPEVLAAAVAFRDWVREQGTLLSLFLEDPAEYLRLLDDMLLAQKNLERAKIDALVAERTAVRAAKDFKKSDELRDALAAMGIALQDSAVGTSWEVAK